MDLLELAKEGKHAFRITFPTGEAIPFRLLTWGEFNTYWEVSRKGHIPQAIIEDAIFRQCCLDSYLADKAYDMRAGVISTVVNIIMSYSGPNLDPTIFNNALDSARPLVDSVNSQVVMLICRAFPAYKPEDIEKMPWEDVVMRLLQAERMLLISNPPQIKEPIRMPTKDEIKEVQKKKPGKIDVDALIADGKKLAGVAGGNLANEQGAVVDSGSDYFDRRKAISAKRREVERKFRGR